MANKTTCQTIDLAMMIKRKPADSCQQLKIRSIKECYNCGKRGHYTKDCRSSLKRKPNDEKAVEEAQQIRWTRNRVVEKAAAPRSTNQDESDLKPYLAGKIFMIKHSNPSLELIDAWYLDTCVSRYICKNRNWFSDLRPNNFEFIITGGELIWSREVRIVHFSLQSRKMTLLNVAYTPKCDSNLI